MSIFSRHRKDRADDDPLLTIAGIARETGRNRTWIYRLASDQRLPEPDELTDTGEGLWRQSTIRTWWVSQRHNSPEGDTSPDGAAGHEQLPRYHRPITDPKPPGRLYETLLLSGSQPGPEIRRPVHVRVFAGVDALAPVVVLGLPAATSTDIPWGPDRLGAADYAAVRAAVPEELGVADDTDVLWVVYRPDGQSSEHMYDLDYRVALWDVSRRGHRLGDRYHALSPFDLHHVTGVDLEAYSPETYTVTAIQAWIRSDNDNPVPLIVDARGLAPLVCDLRRLDDELRRGDTDLADVGPYCASVLAAAIDSIAGGYDWQRSHAAQGGRSPFHRDLEDHVRQAVAPVPYCLNVTDYAVLGRHRPARPISSDPRASGVLLELNSRLNDWPGIAEPTLRAALVEARRRLTDIVYADDTRFRHDHEAPRVTETALVGPTVPYLAQFDPVAEWDTWDFPTIDTQALNQVPDPLRRRAFRLVEGHTRSERGRTVTLLHQPSLDLLAVTFVEPGFPPDRYASFPEGSADRPTVRMEWPRALPDPAGRGPLGGRLVSPPAGAGYRPVYIHVDRQLAPLPSGADMSWGEGGGTDTLTSAVLDFVDPGSEDHTRESLYQWLKALLMQQGPDPLDFDLTIVGRYLDGI